MSTVSVVVQPATSPPQRKQCQGVGWVSMEMESSSAGERRAGGQGGQGAVGRVGEARLEGEGRNWGGL